MKLYAILEYYELDGYSTEYFHGVYNSYEEAHRVLCECCGIHPDNICSGWPQREDEYGIQEINLNEWIPW
jgi:hypothetical protein